MDADWQWPTLDLALRLVETLAGDWDPRRYKDTYRDVLMGVIQRKAAGKEIRAAKVERARSESPRAASRRSSRRPPTTASRRLIAHVV